MNNRRLHFNLTQTYSMKRGNTRSVASEAKRRQWWSWRQSQAGWHSASSSSWSWTAAEVWTEGEAWAEAETWGEAEAWAEAETSEHGQDLEPKMPAAEPEGPRVVLEQPDLSQPKMPAAEPEGPQVAPENPDLSTATAEAEPEIKAEDVEHLLRVFIQENNLEHLNVFA